MRQRPLGETGLRVSEIGLGTWAMTGESYGAAPPDASRRVILRALERGVTLIDVADVYGRGSVERLLGGALAGHRSEVVLSVRIGNDFYRSIVRKNFAPSYLRYALDQSLKRLGTDFVDVVMLHNPSLESMRRGECFDACKQLVQAGKARAWGVSAAGVDEARVAAEAGAQVVQVPYNLVHHTIVHALQSDLPRPRPGIVVHSPLEYGMLAGGVLATTRFGEKDHRRRRYTREEIRQRTQMVERLRFLVKGEVKTLAEAALRFCLANPVVAGVLVGTLDPQHLDEDCAASAPPPLLPDADLTRLAEIVPRGDSAP
jgi:aryl-alcohol dehydrogenase-like predicted oxidoreductase